MKRNITGPLLRIDYKTLKKKTNKKKQIIKKKNGTYIIRYSENKTFVSDF